MKNVAVDISVVIPVFNSGACLPRLIKRLGPVLDAASKSAEVILVDDASADDSWRVINELALGDARIRAIRLMRNAGQATATLCGLREATGTVVITMDDDLQHRPEEIPGLLDALASQPELDCVFGYFPIKKHKRYRNIGSRIIRSVYVHSFGLPKDTHSSGFRAMRLPLAKAIASHGTVNPSVSLLIYESTRHVASLPIEHASREEGSSGYSLGKQIQLALNTICNVTLLPLRAVSVLGFVICVLSFLFAGSVLWKYSAGRIHVAGWTTLSIIVSFSSGLILLALGVTGEYIARILREVRGAPRCVERDRVGFPVSPKNIGDTRTDEG